jgi:hypothetical protein
VVARLSPEQLRGLSNPQALVSAEGGDRLRAVLAGTGALDGVLDAMREALAHSIHEVFVVGAVAVTLALAVCVVLPELPLRTVNRRSAPGSAGERTAAAPAGTLER